MSSLKNKSSLLCDFQLYPSLPELPAGAQEARVVAEEKEEEDLGGLSCPIPGSLSLLLLSRSECPWAVDKAEKSVGSGRQGKALLSRVYSSTYVLSVSLYVVQCESAHSPLLSSSARNYLAPRYSITHTTFSPSCYRYNCNFSLFS